jgi:two-component system LytT family response regulator
MPRTEWTVLIADDEPAARRGVRQLLSVFPEFTVAGECRNGAEVLAALDTSNPDVVFLDVQMPGIDGFEVIRRRTPDRMPAVVFLTAYDQFAIQAFDAQALDYLVKPVSQSRFAATMKRLVRQLSAAVPPDAPETIAVATRTATAEMPVSDIEWVVAEGNYARLWLAGKSYLLRESLRDLERRMTRHGFLRAHRKALVRVGAVRELSSLDGGMVAIIGRGVQIPISRRKRTAFAAAVKGK